MHSLHVPCAAAVHERGRCVYSLLPMASIRSCQGLTASTVTAAYQAMSTYGPREDDAVAFAAQYAETVLCCWGCHASLAAGTGFSAMSNLGGLTHRYYASGVM